MVEKQFKIVYESTQGIFKHYLTTAGSDNLNRIRQQAYDEITRNRNENVTIVDIQEVTNIDHEPVFN